MSKPEVCEYLCKSKRTVETFISRGRLAVGYFQGPNGKTAIFKRVDVEALKREIDTPMYRAVPELATQRQGFAYLGPQPSAGKPESQIAIAPDARDPFVGLAEHLAKLAAAYPSQPKPWLTLAEASEYSGLPASWLLAQARSSAVRALNVGTEKQQRWRFHRKSLTE